jgi:predicted transcriptional regulator
MATKTVTGYRWLARDPILDVFKAAKAASGKTNEEIARDSGVTQATLHKWDYGDTKKPQHLTLAAAMLACGYEETFRNHRTGDTLSASYAKPNRPPKKPKKAIVKTPIPATPT